MSRTALSWAAFSIMRQPRSRLSAVTVFTALSRVDCSSPGTCNRQRMPQYSKQSSGAKTRAGPSRRLVFHPEFGTAVFMHVYGLRLKEVRRFRGGGCSHL